MSEANESDEAVSVCKETDGVFVAHNGRGGVIRLATAGDVDTWTPTELLQAALAGCAALSLELLIDRHLGEGAEETVTVRGKYDCAQRRYDSFSTSVFITGENLDSRQRARVEQSAHRVVHSACRVERTLTHTPRLDLDVQVEP
ncbi:OsmC family protein [Dermatophilus congolensis]|uniref:OsmC family protein n=2 Tax=Dermatophilus congolensis TaxID=1863 RepID=UPI001AAFCE0B|nr:OsmC family protein [Dermatophilus congolensis]MBO3151832.1 OsmC family protein [Dermatophilus congolensis]MBO3161165.1 OsmC family protein [Dermatophilus congolensis]MBO3163114.1 OsmC family protein [Dermatophilus congolensis]MBO3176668.1 OsmC family protein [Dermatophilus congolensis]MBO3183431.1 OsmC family protein [Dermatophilus congolensis]